MKVRVKCPCREQKIIACRKDCILFMECQNGLLELEIVSNQALADWQRLQYHSVIKEQRAEFVRDLEGLRHNDPTTTNDPMIHTLITKYKQK